MAKSNFWDKRGKDATGPWDTIVVGSGMGGMTTAALLSEVGEKVLVLEQHYEPGGFTHTFKRPGGYHWDVGVHAIGEVTDKSMTGRILAQLTKGNLEWESLGEVYDSFEFPDGFKIEFPDTPHKFVANLIEAFPEEEAAIHKYFDETREVAGQMRRWYMSRVMPAKFSGVADKLLGKSASKYFERTVKDVMDELTDNEKLKAVLCSQWGYYGETPENASFAIQALVARHFLWGAYYPVGGSKRIAEGLLGTVANNGGWTRISTSVDEILLDANDVAIGVRCGDEKIFAGRVVSNIGAQATVRRLLPDRFQTEPFSRSWDRLEPAAAHICLYLGFKGVDIAEAGGSRANQWFYNTWDQTIAGWDIKNNAEEWPEAPVLYCSFPSLKDSTHDPGPELRHTGEIVTFVPWKVFEPWMETRWKKRPEAYEELKAEITSRLLKQFFEHRPELEPYLDFVECSTPLTTAHFDRAIGGSIYGLSPTPSRYGNRWLRPSSPVKGLYLSGCDIGSPGVIGAMFGGVLAALAASPLRVTDYLTDFV